MKIKCENKIPKFKNIDFDVIQYIGRMLNKKEMIITFDLNKIIHHEETWNKCFKDKFTQRWITERVKSLYSIRNRVANSSGYLSSDSKQHIVEKSSSKLTSTLNNIKRF